MARKRVDMGAEALASIVLPRAGASPPQFLATHAAGACEEGRQRRGHTRSRRAHLSITRKCAVGYRVRAARFAASVSSPWRTVMTGCEKSIRGPA